MPQPTDEKLYEKIKNELFKKYKPSAYRSGLLVQRYKEEYVKKHKNNNYYKGSKATSNLKRWFDEKWTNQRGEIGYKNKSDVYRPTIRINDKTPTTFNGCIRGTSFTQFASGSLRTFSGGPGQSHPIGSGVILIGQTATPNISHWGSAIL